MIKGDYFGKLLKQSFFTLLIGFFIFGLGCFASAGYTRQVGTYGYNPYLQSLDINLTRAGNPLTSSLGYTKQIFVIQQTNSDFCAWFWNNGLPYNYCTRSRTKQGNIQSYQVCSEILDISQSNKPGNCVFTVVGESTKDIIKNFLSSLTTDDYYWFNYSTTDFGWGDFCISNHSLSSSFCFSFNSSSNNFTNTLNLTGGLKFDSFPTSVLENPPSSSSGGGSSGGGTSITYSGNTVSLNCTYDTIIQYAENNGYSKNLCYGGLDNFNTYNPESTYNPIPGTGKTLGQILANASSTWSTPIEWFNFWNGLYGGYVDMWSSYPAVYKTWFDLYYRYGGQGLIFDSVREYCAMIELDIDFSTTVYRGQYFKNACVYIQKNTSSSNLNVSGNVIVGVNWSGFFSGTGQNLSGNNVNTAVGYIQDFFNLIKTNLGSVNGSSGPGVLPLYIITFMCGLILFRFISH